MAETIMVPFVYPDCEIIQSYPYKFVLSEESFEFFARHTVSEWDEEKSMKVIKDYDSRVKITAASVFGFEMYRSSEFEGMYIFKIMAASDGITMYFDDKTKATELYNKFDKWLFDANS